MPSSSLPNGRYPHRRSQLQALGRWGPLWPFLLLPPSVLARCVSHRVVRRLRQQVGGPELLPRLLGSELRCLLFLDIRVLLGELLVPLPHARQRHLACFQLAVEALPSLGFLCTSHGSLLLVVQLFVVPLVPAGRFQLLRGLQGGVGYEERDGLLYLQRRHLGQLLPGGAQGRGARRKVGIGQEVQLVHQLRKQSLGLGLLLVLLHLALGLGPEDLGLVLLGVYVAQAYPALLEVQGLDRVLLGALRPIGGPYRRPSFHVVEGLIPDPLADDRLNVKRLGAFGKLLCS